MLYRCLDCKHQFHLHVGSPTQHCVKCGSMNREPMLAPGVPVPQVVVPEDKPAKEAKPKEAPKTPAK